MFYKKFLKSIGIRIFLAGFVIIFCATAILLAEIEFAYLGRLWWFGFVVCLIGIIFAMRDMTSWKKT
jgi:hypothetical protein